MSICRVCDKEFEPSENTQNRKVCSAYCLTEEFKAKGLEPFLTCGHCGKELQTVNRQRRFCSVECRTASSLEKTRIVWTDVQKNCEICDEKFTPRASNSRYCSPYCRQAAHLAQFRIRKEKNPEQLKESQKAYREKNVLKTRKSRLKNWYGITMDQYEAILAFQQHKCAICETKLLKDCDTHLDHLHSENPEDKKSSKVRGALCSSCNLGLGKFRDSIEILDSAIEYLKAPPAQNVLSALENQLPLEPNFGSQFPENSDFITKRLQEANSR